MNVLDVVVISNFQTKYVGVQFTVSKSLILCYNIKDSIFKVKANLGHFLILNSIT